jgi:hypothetical protein
MDDDRRGGHAVRLCWRLCILRVQPERPEVFQKLCSRLAREHQHCTLPVSRQNDVTQLFSSSSSIHSNSKEYGFGQSLLHDCQLVFHTPPYSLQPVSLQECYEYLNKSTIRTSRQTIDSKSPLPQKHENLISQQRSKCETSPNSTITRNESGRSSLERLKDRDTASPDGKGRRFSYTASR